MKTADAYPALRYPKYLADYLAAQHGFTFPESAPEAHVPLYDHLFVVALEAHRIRERALPGLIAALEQELGWVKSSLSIAPKGRKPAAVYEQIGDTTTDGLTLRRATHALNEREHEVNMLCRALEGLTATDK